MRLWLAAGLIVAPSVAQADAIVVLGDSATLRARLSTAGQHVVEAAEAVRTLDGAERGDDPDEVRALGVQGREALFARADFGAAVALLERAVAAVPRAGVERFEAGELAHLHLDLGVARLAAGADAAAEEQIAWALRLDPALQLDPTVHGPPVRRVVERLRDAAAHADRVPLSIATHPAGARIAIDGHPVGEGPAEHRVVVGPHYLLAELVGFRPVSRRFEVPRSGANVRLDLPVATPASTVRAALRSGDLERAARTLATAGDRVVVVRRRGDRWTALVVRRGGAEQRLDAPSEARLAAPVLRGLSAVVGDERSSPTDGRAPTWVWVGTGVVLVAGAIVTAIVLARGSGDGERELAGTIE